MADLRRRRLDEDSPDYPDESHAAEHNKDHRLSDAPNVESGNNSGADNLV